jgi:putative RNA 2'-phosphotransferase
MTGCAKLWRTKLTSEEPPPERQTQLSRVVSHALRHEPWVYELELDQEGWTPVDALLTAIREQGPQWAWVDRAALTAMLASATKQRHEIDGDRIRARYGHSVPGKVAKVQAEPPAQLFHGTSPQAWTKIQRQGLRPMGRQYVHLSVDLATAEQVGHRKSPNPVILSVDTTGARETGSHFWHGNELIWLADHIAPKHLTPR